MIIILDVSESMLIENREHSSKLAATSVIETLGLNDYFAVVSFDGEAFSEHTTLI